MYKITYYNNDTLIDRDYNITGYKINQKTYECPNDELDHWLTYITDSYGQWGEVTYEHFPDEPTKEELTIKTINNLTIENKKKDILIASLAEQLNNLNIKLTQLGGSENV